MSILCCSPRVRVRLQWLLMLCAAWVAGSCGDDDGSAAHGDAMSPDASHADAATSSGARGPSGPARGADSLADGIVGGPCTSATDCGSGSCMQTIPIVNTAYPGGYCTGQCSSDDQCGAEGVCVPGLLGRAGSCYLRCDDAHPCERDGYRCRVVSGVGRCIAAPPPLADGIVGSACTADSDCGGAAMSCSTMLGANAAPGGYCSEACAIAEDCGAGGVCINGISIVTISSGRCLKACSAADECRAGYVCTAFGGPSSGAAGACTPVPADADAGTL